jgi:hypothetical protein
MASGLTGSFKSSTSVKLRLTPSSVIVSSLLKSTIYDSIKVNDLRRSHGSSLWPLACFRLICSKGSKQKEKEEDAVTGLLAALSCLEREHLMSAMETVIEGERAIRPGLFVERVQELDNVVSRYLPMLGFPLLEERTRRGRCRSRCSPSAYRHLGQFRGQAQLQPG